MSIIEQHTSPDGFLRLIVDRDDTGDLAIGFDGFSWHTHADILASLSGLSEPEAVRHFIEEIISDQKIIAVSRINGEVREVWPTDDPEEEFRYKPPEETLEFRRWSGATVQVYLRENAQ